MTQYAVVFDKTQTGYSAWVPDLPGCVATGPSLEKAQKLIQGAIEMHIESLQRHDEPVPEPATRIEYIQPLSPETPST
jgi:predicted RNase H-like HicB family nuclease